MAEKQDIVAAITEVGGQYSVIKRYRHPSFAPLVVSGGRNRNVFDSEKMREILESSLSFVEECGKKGGSILFISTRQETVDLVGKTARALSLPFMLNRWIGGTLSNFKNIKSRVSRLEDLRRDKEEGRWTKYTKKERVLLNRELAKLENRFSGIVSLESLPVAVFILDTRKEHIAVAEANGAGIPVIGFSNANADLGKIQHPIIANIHSRETVAYILGLVEKAYQQGVQGRSAEASSDTT